MSLIIGEPKYTKLSGDRLSWREVFTINYRNQDRTIVFCHPFYKGRDNETKPSYRAQFEAFVKTHERFIPEGSTAIDIGGDKSFADDLNTKRVLS